MLRRRTARTLAAVFTAAAAAFLVPAQAAAAPTGADGLPLDELRVRVADTPEIAEALETLVAAATTDAVGSAEPARNVPQPFMQSAPTLGPGCGGGFMPFAMTDGHAHPGPVPELGIGPGQMKVFVYPTVASPVTDTSLTFVWMNMENFRAGVAMLDERIGGVPQLSTTVNPGGGPVMGALFGSVQYANGAFCQVIYTMGGFFV